MASSRRYLLLLTVGALVVAADQATKSLALAKLQTPHDLISGVLTLRVTYNSGGAFGLLQGLPGVFLVATLVAGVAIVVWVRHVSERRWLIPLGLVLGGGLGNVADRIFRDTGGRVVDFIDLHAWPVFNVADAAIVSGVVVLLWLGYRSEEGSSSPPAGDDPA